MQTYSSSFDYCRADFELYKKLLNKTQLLAVTVAGFQAIDNTKSGIFTR